MSDIFESYATGLESPGNRHFPITPDDDTDIQHEGRVIIPRAIRVGGAGNVVIRDGAGTDVTYTCVAGEVLTFRPVRVLATGTTATNIVGWY
jgi:hypothetical protein